MNLNIRLREGDRFFVRGHEFLVLAVHPRKEIVRVIGPAKRKRDLTFRKLAGVRIDRIEHEEKVTS